MSSILPLKLLVRIHICNDNVICPLYGLRYVNLSKKALGKGITLFTGRVRCRLCSCNDTIQIKIVHFVLWSPNFLSYYVLLDVIHNFLPEFVGMALQSNS